MRVIKRDGSEAFFDGEKIKIAVMKANSDVDAGSRVTESDACNVADNVTKQCEALERAVGVEEIQDLVEKELIRQGFPILMRAYTTYRWKRAAERKENTIDGRIRSLLNRTNEEAIQENSNKNPIVNSTMRDYMAGEVSRDISLRYLLPKKIVKMHKEGILYVHDLDYFAQHMYNCCLINIEDMLKNGTVISGVEIESPKSFQTACTVVSQVASQVSSNQLGGETISLAHLAPYVDVSRQKIKRKLREEWNENGFHYTEEQLNEATEKRLRKEVSSGIQTFQYQVQTILSTNG